MLNTFSDGRILKLTRIVLSIGGSVLVPDEKDVSYIVKLAELLTKLSEKYKLFIVTGGGRIARYYIETGRELGVPEQQLDDLGIIATRMNARLLGSTLREKANHIPPETVEGTASLESKFQIVIMGGTTPGWTTDFVAASLAKEVKADRLVNATSVDGVYSSDPRKNKKAKRYEKVTYEELIRLSGETHTKAGPTTVFDPAASKLMAAAKIPLFIVNGRDLKALSNSIEGKPFHGTRVEEG